MNKLTTEATNYSDVRYIVVSNNETRKKQKLQELNKILKNNGM